MYFQQFFLFLDSTCLHKVFSACYDPHYKFLIWYNFSIHDIFIILRYHRFQSTFFTSWDNPGISSSSSGTRLTLLQERRISFTVKVFFDFLWEVLSTVYALLLPSSVIVLSIQQNSCTWFRFIHSFILITLFLFLIHTLRLLHAIHFYKNSYKSS